MDIKVSQGNILESGADTIIVNLFEGVETPAGATGAVNEAFDGMIGRLISRGDISSKLGDVSVLHIQNDTALERILVAGLGPQEKFDLEQARRAGAAAIKKARDVRARQVATIVHGGGIGGLEPAAAAQAVVEGSLLAVYQYEAQRQKTEESHQITALEIVEFDEGKVEAIRHGAKTAQAVVAGVILARDLVNMPPNVATPTRLAQAAEEIAEAHQMQLVVGDREWAREREMGAFLAVAAGAGEPPKFIVLEHNGDRQELDTIVLVGKGITFDTGGISIKPTENMGDMKTDMGGAAAVLGTMKVVGMLELPLRVIGIAPCTENMPDANAYRPADVVRASNGKTIEIISTDAEGRMVLADGLVHAGSYNPKAVIDLATLTGSAIVALGSNMAAALFSTEEWLQDKLVEAGQESHERVWPLPLWEEYREAIKSDVADMKNSGGRFGGVATSAIFLHSFTDYPWAHLDIAGMAYDKKGSDYSTRGATGFGVRLLTQFLHNWATE